MIDGEIEAPAAAPADSPSAPSAPAKTEPAAAKVPEKPDPYAEEKALDDDLRKTFRRATEGRNRDDAGRYAPREAKDNEPAPVLDKDAKASPAKPVAKAGDKQADVVEKPAAGEEQKAAEAPKKLAPPRSWKAEVAAEWEKLPPTVQEYVSQRETEAHRHISKLGEIAKSYEPLGQAINKHAAYIDQTGMDPAEMVDSMFAVSHWLDTNPSAAIEALAKRYGVDLGRFAPDPLADAPDPRVSALEQQLARLQNQLAAQESQRWQAEQGAYEQAFERNESTVQQFLTGKEDAEEIAADLLEAVKAIRSRDPQAPPQQVLAEAYERAQWANPKSRAKQIERQVAEQERARIEAARKAAEQAKGAASRRVGSVPGQHAGDMDTDLKSIWRKNHAAA